MRRGPSVVRRRITLGGCVVAMALVGGATPAFAEQAWWHVESRAAPTTLRPGEPSQLDLVVSNLGTAAVDGRTNRVTVTDTLPPGLRAVSIKGLPKATAEPSPRDFTAVGGELEPVPCVVSGQTVTCTFGGNFKNAFGELVPDVPLQAFGQIEVFISVEVEPEAFKRGELAGAQNSVVVKGGRTGRCEPVAAGTGKFADARCTRPLEKGGGSFEDSQGAEVAEAKATVPLVTGETATSFGVEHYELIPEEEGGSFDTRAGSHPFQLTTTLDLNQIQQPFEVNQRAFGPGAPALTKELSFRLPPGLIGNTTALPQCTYKNFTSFLGDDHDLCAANTAIGVSTVTFSSAPSAKDEIRTSPVFNLEPAPGEPARFGISFLGVAVLLDTSVTSGGDYAAEVHVTNSPESTQLLGSRVTFWGTPGDTRHNVSRGWGCLEGGLEGEPCTPLQEPNPQAFLTLPTSCSGPLATTVEGHSWPTMSEGAGFGFAPVSSSLPSLIEGMHECQNVPFSPSLEVGTGSGEANTPSALSVKVHLPQDSTREENGVGEAAVKDTVLKLPQGVQLSPSAANGLEACSEEQVGYLGTGAAHDPLDREAEEPRRFTNEPANCPDASKVGIVHIKSPDLAKELEGSLYLAAQTNNPFGSLFAMYMVAEEEPKLRLPGENPASRVRVKLAGEVKVDPVTGQITTTFENTPQTPFEDLTVELFGGPRASVTTPPLCGGYAASAVFTPWSGTEPVTALSNPASFTISSGPGGAPCSNPLPFAPSFEAGATSVQASGYTPFSVTIGRPDGDQTLQEIAVRTPPGLAAMISHITPCPEPQASKGECGPESLIGHTTTTSGLGSDPFTLGGNVYITGPYEGAPFGLSIVTPTKAGPFDFGNDIVRASINIDPNTAAVTIRTKVPATVETESAGKTGVPVQLKQTNVTVDRPQFELNPTNCKQQKIDGTFTGSEGTVSTASTPFAVANCAQLKFHPEFSATTSAHTSKANGASLKVKIGYPEGANYANIEKSVTDLPEALPSRLTTLQKACVDTVFEGNPAACPAASVIGEAVARTPVFKNPLRGPAYLVSHGNRSFPDLEIVLQGEGVTLVLDGQTDIKHGVTKTSFNSVPDAPVSNFELNLPEGPHSALAANGNLCAPTKLAIVKTRVKVRRHGRTVTVVKNVKKTVPTQLLLPTVLTAQNGAVVKQQSKIKVEGCQAVKSSKHKKKPKKHKKKKH